MLAMLSIGGREIIEEADCGYAVAPGDYKALAEIIRKKVLTDRTAFEQKGANGRAYYLREFERSKCIDHLEEIIKN